MMLKRRVKKKLSFVILGWTKMELPKVNSKEYNARSPVLEKKNTTQTKPRVLHYSNTQS